MPGRLALVPAPGHRNSQGGTVRRDKRGRRIGRNWWREYICSVLLDARLTWERECERVALGYDTETAEFAMLNPRPTLKQFLLCCAGMARDDAAA